MAVEESIGELYYQLNKEKPGYVCLLDKQAPAYCYALGRLYENAGVTWKPDQKVLFGGFYPDHDNNRASKALVELMREENSPEGQKDFSLSCVLDISDLPVIKAREGGKDAIQANLADLPFASNSLDVVILDYTVHFMQEETRERMFSRLYNAISQSGLVFIATNSTVFADLGRPGRFIDSQRAKRANKVRFWNNRPIEPHLKKYKKVYFASCDRIAGGNFDLTVVARQESPFNKYKYAQPAAIDIYLEEFGRICGKWEEHFREAR